MLYESTDRKNCCGVESDVLNVTLMDSILSHEVHPSHLMAWAARTQSIDLIEEDDTRCWVASPLEDLSDSPLTLSHILHTNTETHGVVDKVNRDDSLLQDLWEKLVREQHKLAGDHENRPNKSPRYSERAAIKFTLLMDTDAMLADKLHEPLRDNLVKG